MKRFRVGYAMHDGNTYEHSEHDTLVEAQTAFKACEANIVDRFFRLYFVIDMDNPERGDISDYDPED